MSKKLSENPISFDQFIEDNFSEYLVKDELNTEKVRAISTGSLSLDVSIGIGGIPLGRFTEIYGAEGCLSGDTYIRYEIRDHFGKRQNGKGGTIENLYKRFNHIHREGRGNYQRNNTLNSNFFVPSINNNNAVFMNLINDVIYCGVKDTYKVETECGSNIVCTDEHKFYVGNGIYKRLSELNIGDTVYIHNNTNYTCKHKSRKLYSETTVKYHPRSLIKVISGKIYYRIDLAHFVFEATANGFSVDKYRDILNSGDKKYINTLWFVPNGYDIHHIDENPQNNDISNLQLIEKIEHYKYHSKKNILNFSFVVQESKIKSIEYFGKIDTYDIKCYSPNNNYIANRIVVHNSGKTTLALSIVKSAINSGYKVLYVDSENGLDHSYIHGIVGEFDGSKLRLVHPDTMEQSLAIAEAGIKSKEFGLIILDSIGSLAPKKVKEDELTDANVALIASRLTVFVQRNGYAIQSSNVSFIGINQVRDKIGSYFNEMHTPGGHAWKHILSLRIQLARASDIEQDGEKIGIMTRFVIKKNKLARPFRTYMIPIMFGKGIDSTRDLIEFATMLGVLDKSGPYVKYNGNTIGLGIAKTADAFISNPELMQEIISKCYESVK